MPLSRAVHHHASHQETIGFARSEANIVIRSAANPGSGANHDSNRRAKLTCTYPVKGAMK